MAVTVRQGITTSISLRPHHQRAGACTLDGASAAAWSSAKPQTPDDCALPSGPNRQACAVSTSAAGRGAGYGGRLTAPASVFDAGAVIFGSVLRTRRRQDRGLRLFARLHLVMIWVLTGCSGWAAATRSMRYLSFIRLCGGLVLLSRSPAFQGRRAAHAAHDDPGCLQRLGDPLAR